MGFEYDLVHRLAQDLGVRVEMIVPPEGTDPLDWLREGRGDLVAAGLTARDISAEPGVALSRPYNVVTEDIVKRSDDLLLTGPHDLRGRRIVVRRDSSYWSTLSQPAARALGYELVAAPDHLTTEQIIHMVADGELDLTLADTHLVDIEGAWRGGVQNAFALSAPVELVWAVRKSNSELLEAVNAYLEQIYRSEFYNVKYEQYFRNPSRVRAHQQERLATLGQFSEWDELVKETAARYGFDWRLIVSQMYQESRFDPNARSFAGAEGLMQVLPRTAKQLGFEDLTDPQVAIEAGIMYLDWVRERFEPELDARERLWFTLAAYNAGPGHVRDARRLAAELGKDPNRWFGHVEEAIQLLAHPDHAQRARYGYCRGTEPVRYVAEVRDRYLAYVTTLAAL